MIPAKKKQIEYIKKCSDSEHEEYIMISYIFNMYIEKKQSGRIETMKTQLENLDIVAKENNLTERSSFTLTGLFCKRFADCNDQHYMTQWAKRIYNATAWACGDSETRTALYDIQNEYIAKLKEEIRELKKVE